MALRAILSNDNPVTVRAEARTPPENRTGQATARVPVSTASSSRAVALER